MNQKGNTLFGSVVLETVRCADAAYCCLKGRSPILVVLSNCPFVDGTAGIGIRLSVVVSMLGGGHLSDTPGLNPGVSHDAIHEPQTVGCSWGCEIPSFCFI